MLLVAGLVLISPVSASGETFPAECSNVQSTVTSVGAKPNHGEGDVILLNGMCTASGVTILNGSSFTLRGAPGTTSGFDGTAISGSLLSAGEAGALTVAELTFEHGSDIGHSAVYLRATRLTLLADSFLENSNENPTSGALSVWALAEPRSSPIPATDRRA